MIELTSKEAARFMAKFVAEPSTGCWKWLGAYAGKYGRVTIRKRCWQATHIAYFFWKKTPIPRGLELDHLCRNPGCVNPEHLEAVTRLENIRRQERTRATTCKIGHPYSKIGYCLGCVRLRIGTKNPVIGRTACPKGHSLTPENRIPNSVRCRTCNREQNTEWVRNHRAALAAQSAL